MKKESGLAQMAAIGIAVLAVGVGSAMAMKIELPPEAARLKEGAGADLANAQCMTCHSADYVITQPRDKPLAFWRAEVEKMKKVYGAPVPDDQIAPIAEYLARNYGSGS